MNLEDRAQEHELKIWERNNRPRADVPTYAPGEAGYGPPGCARCDDPMPTLRRQMGKMLCTGCQARHEATGRR